MNNPRRDTRREGLRPYNAEIPPLQNFMQGRNGAGTAITRAIRPFGMMQPGNTPWKVIRPMLRPTFPD